MYQTVKEHREKKNRSNLQRNMTPFGKLLILIVLFTFTGFTPLIAGEVPMPPAFISHGGSTEQPMNSSTTAILNGPSVKTEWLYDHTKADNSEPGNSYEAELDGVTQGWTDILNMQKGEIYSHTFTGIINLGKTYDWRIKCAEGIAGGGELGDWSAIFTFYMNQVPGSAASTDPSVDKSLWTDGNIEALGITPDATINVKDIDDGLDVSTANFQFSKNGGTTFYPADLDFSAGSRAKYGTTANSGTWTESGDTYNVISAPEAHNILDIAIGDFNHDNMFRFDHKHTSGNNDYLVFDFVDSDNYKTAGSYNGKATIKEKSGGTWNTLNQETVIPIAGNWWDNNWKIRRTVTIENLNSALTDFQVKMRVYCYPNMKADFSDIRFRKASDGSEVKYYIAEKVDGAYAEVWVKTSLIATEDTDLHMYYNNISATSESDANNVFDFYDDFEDASIDGTKWTETESGGVVSESGGEFNINWTANNCDCLVTGSTGMASGIMEFKARVLAEATDSAFFFADTAMNMQIGYNSGGTTDFYANSVTYGSENLVAYDTNSHTFKITATGSNFMLAVDGIEKLNHPEPWGITPKFGCNIENGRDAQIWLDWVLMRKYAAKVPTVKFKDMEAAGENWFNTDADNWVKRKAIGLNVKNTPYIRTSTGTVDVNIIDGNDDAEEDSGSMMLSNSPISIGKDPYTCGFRFQNIAIPQGATITSAYIEFKAKSGTSSACDVDIFADDIANSLQPTSTANDLSSRTKTTSTVNWTPGTWSGDTLYQSPDIKDIVSELVAIPAWISGNAMTFLFEYNAGSDLRESYDHADGFPARLVIEWTRTATVTASDVTTYFVSIAMDDDDAKAGTDNKLKLGDDLKIKLDEDKIACRFQVNIPPNAVITEAYLELVSLDVHGGSPSDYTIYGEDVSNSAAFVHDALITARAKTSSQVIWTIQDWTTGFVDQSPDIKNIVQEIVGSGWTSGNYMTFMIFGNASSLERKAMDYTKTAPKLVIKYHTDAKKYVSNSEDDAEELISSSSVDLTSMSLEMINDGGDQLVGLRFRNNPIPKGAIISKAYLRFHAREAGTTATSLTVKGEKNVNAPAFTSANSDISGRTTTTASASWNNIEDWNDEEHYYSPNLADIIQEIITAPGWADDNPLVFILSGSGTKKAHSFDDVLPGDKPELIVEYIYERILSDVQVKLDITYDSDMQADFDDLRFTTSDGYTEIPYWIEFKADSSYAEVWLRVPKLPTGDSKIYMYSGNSTVSANSNAIEVFEVFDDFDNNSIDTGIWNVDAKSGTIAETGGQLKISSAASCDWWPGTNNAPRAWIDIDSSKDYTVDVKLNGYADYPGSTLAALGFGQDASGHGTDIHAIWRGDDGGDIISYQVLGSAGESIANSDDPVHLRINKQGNDYSCLWSPEPVITTYSVSVITNEEDGREDAAPAMKAGEDNV
ncbi:DUF2341 domain-containing protein, partial [bacterium]|nr:DUF2341 domain-containing protein [bacterium]